MVQRIKDFLTNEGDELRGKLRAALIAVSFLIGVILLLLTPVIAYEFIYQDTIFAGVSINGIQVGGLTREEAVAKLNSSIDAIKEKGLSAQYEGITKNIPVTQISTGDPDLSYDLFFIPVEELVNEAFLFGRNKALPYALIDQGRALLSEVVIEPIVILDPKFTERLRGQFQEYENPSEDAHLVLENNEISVSEGKSGFEIDYDAALEKFREEFSFIHTPIIQLSGRQVRPRVTKEDFEKYIADISELISVDELLLTYTADHEYTERSWVISKEELVSMITIADSVDGQNITLNGVFEDFLSPIAEEINTPAQNAKFSIDEGKVEEFSPGVNGTELNVKETAQAVLAVLEKKEDGSSQVRISLVTSETEPEVTVGDVNDLGITELLAVGESDFSGSSSNRVKNIRRASELLDGHLIKPGEEFSLVAILGDITAANGYFPEWVIKGDRTVKEYGGGLCQIGTTVFRGALRAGVPITERRNHSYAVSYYTPYGTDATIYGPHPDFRFINDTGHHILIQTHVEPPYLYYEFWGTDDGRSVELTDPVTYNVTPPPPRKLIETTDLPPGEIRCVERARNGLDASFSRTVLDAEGEEMIDETYVSHYRPWPEICEIGVDPDAPEEGADTEEETEPGDQEEDVAEVTSE